MGMRTVRLDEEAEKTLARLRKTTGLSISQVLKRGLQVYEQHASREGEIRPYEIYRRLDLGRGGWSVAPAQDAKRAITDIMGRKLAR